ncbi:MAG: hypothetical protein II861_04460 [Methanomicrobium sp.]|nr:hypothetical protein [Methanomicrobium sp.]
MADTDKKLKAADIAEISGISEREVRNISDEFASLIPSHTLGRIKIYEEKAVEVISKINSLKQSGTASEDIFTQFGKAAPAKKSTKERMTETLRKNQASLGARAAHITKDYGNSIPPDTKTRTSKKSSATTKSAEKAEKGETAEPPSMISMVTDAVSTAEKRVNRLISLADSAPDSEVADKIGAAELRISKLTLRIEKIESEIAAMQKTSERNMSDIKDMLSSLEKRTDIANEWVNYFEKSLDEYKASQDAVCNSLKKSVADAAAEIEELKKPFWKRK